MKSIGINPLLFPLVVAQGMWVRRITPRLPDAAGPVEGITYPSDDRSNHNSNIKIILLGESTVAGIGAPTHDLALSGQTARFLALRKGKPVHWLALGRSGANARDVREELAPQLAGKEADVVVIALGVNDSTGLNSLDGWKADMTRLVENVREHVSGAKIILSGPPPLESFPAFPRLLANFLGARSRMLDHGLAQLAQVLPNVIHAPMIEGLSEKHFCSDKFHPSTAGYAAWGEYLSGFIDGQIER